MSEESPKPPKQESSLSYEIASIGVLLLDFLVSAEVDLRRGRNAEQILAGCGGIAIIMLAAVGVSRIWKRARNRLTTAKVALATLVLLLFAEAGALMAPPSAPRRTLGGSHAPERIVSRTRCQIFFIQLFGFPALPSPN